MVVAHVIEKQDRATGSVDPWFLIVSGRSAALFALLAGLTIALSSTLQTEPRVTLKPGTRTALVVRSVLVAVIGLGLGTISVGVAVILTYYGLLFLCALPVLRWGARALALLAIGWGLASPVASMALRPHLPPATYNVPAPSMLSDPLGLATELLVTGYYPVLTWATYLFAGMAIGRLPLRRRWVGPRLLLVGLWLAVFALGVSAVLTRSEGVQQALLSTEVRFARPATWPQMQTEMQLGFFGTTPPESAWWLGVWVPHSGSIVDLAHTTGCAMAVLGALLMATTQLNASTQRAVSIVFGAGSVTLTLYVVHVFMLAGPEQFTMWFNLTCLAGIGALLAWLRAPGPLEYAVSESAKSAGRTLR